MQAPSSRLHTNAPSAARSRLNGRDAAPPVMGGTRMQALCTAAHRILALSQVLNLRVDSTTCKAVVL